MCKVIIIGASGHGKVIADIIKNSGDELLGFLDDNIVLKEVLGYPRLGVIKDCTNYPDIRFIIGIGNNEIRKKIAEEYPDLKYYTAIHPRAVIATDVVIGEGSCVMANAVINTSAKVGKHCIINTGSVVEHDNVLEDYVHISPKAALGGTVRIGERTHIGIGATVKNNIEICKNCTIGAGAMVVKNIGKPAIYIGIPAKIAGGG